MDDTLKIKVLMVYYEHWGKEEIKARKTAYGADQTLTTLKSRFQTRNDQILSVCLQKMFHYLFHDHSFQELYVVWIDFTEIFLQSFAFEMLLDHNYYSEEGRLDARKNRLCDSLRLEGEESILLLYNELSPQEIMSVDAIVALF